MARKIGLSIYGLSIWDNANNRVDLNNVINGKSIIDIIKSYIEENQDTYSTDTKKEVLFYFEKVKSEKVNNNDGQEECNILYGRVKTGEYGIESELVNVKTREVYKRTQEEADMMPFGFCIAVPKGSMQSGVICLQTNGVFGMKLSLQMHLEQCIAKINPEFQLLFKTITPKEYIDRYFKKGVLNKIRMIRYDIPEDITERMGINSGVKHTKEERIIHKPEGFLQKNKKKIEEWMNGQRNYTEVVELDDFEYDEIKFEFSLEGDNKTFNLKDVGRIAVNENITKKVILAGGHPVFESLVPVMKDIARMYLVGMGLIVERKK